MEWVGGVQVLKVFLQGMGKVQILILIQCQIRITYELPYTTTLATLQGTQNVRITPNISNFKEN